MTWRRLGRDLGLLIGVPVLSLCTHPDPGRAQSGPAPCGEVQVSHPVWSPDGRRIAFLSDASGSYELYLLDLENRSVRRLTENDGFEGSVSWSPSSDAFVFWTQLEDDDDFEGYRYDVATGSLDKAVGAEGHDFDLDWSPDGRRVVFQSERTGSREIFLLELASRELRRLTTNDHEDLTPDWSPDGRRVAFASDRTGRRQIHVMDLESGRASYLSGQPDGANYFPIWDPSGRRLLVTSRQDDTYSLHLLDIDGKRSELLASSVRSGPASWSPDGRRVALSGVQGDGSEIRLLTPATGEVETIVTCEMVRARSTR